MHIHILGICGTFMGSLAQLAKALGHKVTGSDQNVYPPMSTQLEQAGIELYQGFSPDQLLPEPDLVVVGNVISRGNPAMEAVLDKRIPYISGPQWLSENLLRHKWVLAVAGTHGKTTTASMLAWILEYSGYQPGYLIGGVPGNFDVSARLGESDFFVIEADEYDTAFFDKRSKFVHYHPDTLILNNLEFDHADIFDDLAAIQKQFHHLIRTVPSQGLVISPRQDTAIQSVLDMGCWSEQQSVGDTSLLSGSGVLNGEGLNDEVLDDKGLSAEWSVQDKDSACSSFSVCHQGNEVGQVSWPLTGRHNMMNGLNALVAARHVGVEPHTACEALSQFAGVKRRMELLAQSQNVSLYDDFAHHPTAIKTTLSGLRAKVGGDKILAIIEPRSNTMKQGVHKDLLAVAANNADQVIWFQPAELNWTLSDVIASADSQNNQRIATTIDEILDDVAKQLSAATGPCHIVVMSNGGFAGIHQQLKSLVLKGNLD